MTRKRTTENDLLAKAAPAPARRTPAARTRSRRTASPVEATAAPAPVVPEAAPEAVLPVEAAVALAPAYQDIAALAYSFWEARGFQGGSAEEDWLRAEHELRARAAAAVA